MFGTYLMPASLFHILVCLKNPEMYSSWIPYIEDASITEKTSNFSSLFSTSFTNIPFIGEQIQSKFVNCQWSVIERAAARHRHCAKALSIVFIIFSLFLDVLKQCGKAVLDKTVPGKLFLM